MQYAILLWLWLTSVGTHETPLDALLVHLAIQTLSIHSST